MSTIPKHIAIIMDGNGRWAKARHLPRTAGHVQGVARVKEITKHCVSMGVKCLTLFAFGRENWARPQEEVSFLMNLLAKKLDTEFRELHKQNIKIRFIGQRDRLNKALIEKINNIEAISVNNTALHLNIAVDYSGSYDIIQAVNRIIKDHPSSEVDDNLFKSYLLTYPDDEPDLFIRTSGESRLSNFMLWQVMYSELYFTDLMWPQFGAKELDLAIEWYSKRERRYGLITEQLKSKT